ncbi:hypothetical protein BATDEDRAFT_85576 [Batrachochytrium dendrobatidis JAM81]|uniref:Uncharacterized protein n=1 Tax=Batrachochytrium dendrobatidis (strain JAM81 / FGSC 10211) TaxID=684364 RepID=F4NST4_BATDJ|nr:uncharacterized protein BATDEDRAFT_85576 [Batrachochytrium dendrobatidis JAM81]EGF83846.1 hypothetical protein BATDEDRAFT_85576 [Batrachochytrium dendrobatidis JAM81]|eukprot:XP_006676243.1 hypothetical protein BATDEDRAFT_85576 [Batrachochytrium dendrobatidis JAM81]
MSSNTGSPVTAEALSAAASASVSPAPTPKKSNKCYLEGCGDRVVKIVGDCRYW